MDCLGGGGWGEEFRSLGEVGGLEKGLGGDGGDVRVGDEPVAVCEGDAEGFDDCVEVLWGVVLGRGEGWDLLCGLEFFEDAEGY